MWSFSLRWTIKGFQRLTFIIFIYFFMYDWLQPCRKRTLLLRLESRRFQIFRPILIKIILVFFLQAFKFCHHNKDLLGRPVSRKVKNIVFILFQSNITPLCLSTEPRPRGDSPESTSLKVAHVIILLTENYWTRDKKAQS